VHSSFVEELLFRNKMIKYYIVEVKLTRRMFDVKPNVGLYCVEGL